MGEIFDYLWLLVIGFLEYPAWIIRYVVEQFLGQFAAVFAITFALQKMRCGMRRDRYGRLWKVLLAIGLLWGGIALVMYIPNFVDWYKEYFFLPSVIFAAGLAKLQLKLKAKSFLLLLVVLLGVVVLSYSIIKLYDSSVNDFDRHAPIDRMFEIHRWLTGQPDSEHKRGGGGGGMLGILGGSGKADWNWGLFYSHGILLLVGVMVVPPSKMNYNVPDLCGMNGNNAVPNRAD